MTRWTAWASFAALASIAAPGAMAAETAQGTVFADENANGVFDSGEAGIAGVAVSNGRDVVTTNANGHYRLKVEPRDILFVTKPTGYRVPVNEDQIPQFYYIHDPQGTPESLGLRYEGVAPTGPLPASIDFALLPQDEADRFNVIVFADPQPQTVKELEFIRDDVVGELVDTDAAFGITAGDIMYDDLSMFPRYNAIIGQVGIPWYNVAGNHELNFLSPDDTYSSETYKRFFGPTNYSFDYAGAHFVMMDDVYYLGRNNGRETPHPREAGAYEGFLTKDQLTWLKNDLAQVDKDKLIVLVMHIPLSNRNAPDTPSISVKNRKALFRILRGHDRVLSLAGHMHTTEVLYFGKDDGFKDDNPLMHHTLTTVSGSWWSGPRDVRGIPMALQADGVPNGYNILTIDGNKPVLRYKAAGRPDTYQMDIRFDSHFHLKATRDFQPMEMQTGPITTDQVYSTDVVVNLFNGGPDSTVTYQIGSRAPVTMTRKSQPDLRTIELLERYKSEYKSWVNAWPAHHIWVADLPRDLEAGTHLVKVTGVDAYGVAHTGQQVLEVVSRK